MGKLIFFKLFFIFSNKIEMLTQITGKNINPEKISLGKLENKISGKFRYTITPAFTRKNLLKSLFMEKLSFSLLTTNHFQLGWILTKKMKIFLKVLRKKYQIFMVKNYASSKHLIGIQEFMQNFL